ncbi:hypothetical protein OG735_41665 (plasmid) [Streptomyces sp. NBC_01210]|uniref:hypothetical protein n=1 Tax=Streptomyces sp. NBC_01210 TaxID=2903774 RepID=UPI002E15776C|nr:hypothetical protein OG735_41665 [Streptomyces sp. NBC_01210]
MDASAFPHNLVQAQRDFGATYEALAAPGRHGNTELRRRLLRLSVRILWHPFWTAHPSGAPAARIELRRQARADQSEARAA